MRRARGGPPAMDGGRRTRTGRRCWCPSPPSASTMAERSSTTIPVGAAPSARRSRSKARSTLRSEPWLIAASRHSTKPPTRWTHAPSPNNCSVIRASSGICGASGSPTSTKFLTPWRSCSVASRPATLAATSSSGARPAAARARAQRARGDRRDEADELAAGRAQDVVAAGVDDRPRVLVHARRPALQPRRERLRLLAQVSAAAARHREVERAPAELRRDQRWPRRDRIGARPRVAKDE